jgi:hypothetical protein
MDGAVANGPDIARADSPHMSRTISVEPPRLRALIAAIRKRRSPRARLGLAAGLVLLLFAVLPARAQMPGQLIDAPPPQSAAQKQAPLDSAFQDRLVEPGHLRATGALEKSLEGLPAFLRDTNFTLKPRTYYFDQSDPSGKIDEAWALGGSLEYKSGLAWDRVWVGAEFFGSWPLNTGPNAGDTLLLSSQGTSYSVLGQAYVAAKLSDNDQLIVGDTTSVDTPYANRQFNRMTPNAFQGVLLNGFLGDDRESQKLHYLLGYLDKIKERNSNQFVPMSQAAGSSVNQGTALGGVRYIHNEFSVGLVEYYTPDVLNIFYAGVEYTPHLSGPYELKLSAQFTDQLSLAGATGTPLPNQWGVEAVASRAFAVLTLAFTQTADAGNLSSPWGSSPSFTRAAIHDSSRAGEDAVLGSLSYHFNNWNLPGLSATAVGVYYWNAVSTPSSPQPNQTEVDLYLDYKPPKGVLQGLWFRLQPNWEWNAGGGTTTQWRAIVYWEVPLI